MGDTAAPTTQHPIIQVRPRPELKGQWLYGCCEEQGAEGVPLLNTARGRQDVVAKLQAGRLAVAPGCPACQGREVHGPGTL